MLQLKSYLYVVTKIPSSWSAVEFRRLRTLLDSGDMNASLDDLEDVLVALTDDEEVMYKIHVKHLQKVLKRLRFVEELPGWCDDRVLELNGEKFYQRTAEKSRKMSIGMLAEMVYIRASHDIVYDRIAAVVSSMFKRKDNSYDNELALKLPTDKVIGIYKRLDAELELIIKNFPVLFSNGDDDEDEDSEVAKTINKKRSNKERLLEEEKKKARLEELRWTMYGMILAIVNDDYTKLYWAQEREATEALVLLAYHERNRRRAAEEMKEAEYKRRMNDK